MADNEGINQDQTVSSGIDQRLQTKLIADTIHELGACEAFANWVRQQELEYVLRRSGLRTLFAPTDQAFRPPASGDPPITSMIYTPCSRPIARRQMAQRELPKDGG